MNKLQKARFSSEINRINNRLRTIEKNLGADSPIYQNEVSKLLYWLPDENIRYNKNNVIQIAKPSNLADKMSITNLKNINVKTYSQVKKEYGAGYEDIKKDMKNADVSIPSISEYINAMSNLAENIYSLYQRFSSADESRLANRALNILHKSKNSYNELYEVSQIIGELTTV